MIRRFSSRRERLDTSFLNDRLKGAHAYDRIAGYFSSSILEVAGENLDQITGTVRMVCNSQLDAMDVKTDVGWRVAVRYALCENPIRGMSTETRVGLIAGLDEEEKGPVDKKQVTFADLARE